MKQKSDAFLASNINFVMDCSKNVLNPDQSFLNFPKDYLK